MSPRKDFDERIDGLEPVERAWRELGDETPPDLVDQAVLNRARLAVEKPPRAWTFNLTWVHGLATMGVAALALTLFLQLRDEVPRAPDPAAFEVQLQKSTAERKDEDATVGALREQRQSLNEAAEAMQPPAASPPVPEYEFSEPLADAPSAATGEGREADTPAEVEEALDQIIVTGNRARDAAAKQAEAPEESFHRAEPVRKAAETAMLAEPATGLEADNEAGIEIIYLEDGDSLVDDFLQAPVYPPAKINWPKDPDEITGKVCRVSGSPRDAVARANAECESFTFADTQFKRLRAYRARGETDNYQRLRTLFLSHYPNYTLPEDLAE